MTEKEKIDIGIDKHKILQDIKEKESKEEIGMKPIDIKEPIDVKKPKTKPNAFLVTVNSMAPGITIFIAVIWLAIFLSTQSVLALAFALSLFLIQSFVLLAEYWSLRKVDKKPKQKPS